MRTLFSDLVETYDGSQLRGGWLAETFALEPDAVAAFTGPCDVAREHMIDLEDLEARRVIVAREMLHFIAEHADGDLERTVLRQRLLVTCAREALPEGSRPSGFEREGDDLFLVRGGEKRKLSVSVATRSRAKGSGLIHLGINIDPAGAPVPAVGLAELGVRPAPFAEDVMRRYSQEVEGARRAAGKVREAP